MEQVLPSLRRVLTCTTFRYDAIVECAAGTSRGLARRLVAAPFEAVFILLYLPLLPLIFIVIVLPMVAWQVLCMRSDSCRLYSRLATWGRTASWDEIEAHLNGGGVGTMICERPFVGWNVLRLWWEADQEWTRDTTAPPAPGDLKSCDLDDPALRAFSLWAARTWTSPETGAARLVEVAHGRDECRDLEKRLEAFHQRHANALRIELDKVL